MINLRDVSKELNKRECATGLNVALQSSNCKELCWCEECVRNFSHAGKRTIMYKENKTIWRCVDGSRYAYKSPVKQ